MSDTSFSSPLTMLSASDAALGGVGVALLYKVYRLLRTDSQVDALQKNALEFQTTMLTELSALRGKYEELHARYEALLNERNTQYARAERLESEVAYLREHVSDLESRR